MRLPLVSVGLPTLDRAHLLPRALDSLVAQTYPNLEIVVSDNCSSDRTLEICERYSSHYPSVRYRRQPVRVPVMTNFRTAFALTSGRYFMWASDDDHWAPTFVTKLVAELETDPDLALVAAEAQYRLSDGTLLEFFPEGEFWYQSRQRAAAQRMLSVIRHNYGNLIYGIYRRETLTTPTGTIIDRMKFVNEIPLFIRVAEAGEIRVLPEVLFFKTTNMKTYQAAAREYGFRPQSRLVLAPVESAWLRFLKEIYQVSSYHLATFFDVMRALVQTNLAAVQKLRLGLVATLTLGIHLCKVVVAWPVADAVTRKDSL